MSDDSTTSDPIPADEPSVQPGNEPAAEKKPSIFRTNRILPIIVIAVVVVALVVGAIATVRAVSAAAGSRYDSTDYNYSVVFPGKPTVPKRSGATSLEVVRWTEGKAVYLIQARPIDSPKSQAETDKFLETSLAAGVGATAGKVTSAPSSTTIGGAHAIEESFSSASVGNAYEAALVRKGKLYVIIVAGVPNEKREAFVKSLAFTD